jgi:hypothetical protein
MPDQQAFRYVDSRGDVIIYKFDPKRINHPTEPAVTVFHVSNSGVQKRILNGADLCSLLEGVAPRFS